MRVSTVGHFSMSSCISAALLAGCGGSQQMVAAPNTVTQPSTFVSHASTRWPVQHLIVVIQEDRSFDDIFAGYPGADAPTFGCASGTKGSNRARSLSSGCPSGDTVVPLKPVRMALAPCGFPPSGFQYFDIAWDNGLMDGWNRLDRKRPLCPYTHVESSQTARYWNLAKKYTMADHMFASTRFGKIPDQLYLLAGTTKVAPATYVIGLPSGMPGGCDSPPGTRTTILRHGRVILLGGPFPCFTQFPTMANLFDQAGVSWKYYYEPPEWSGFEAIKYVFDGPDWKNDMSVPATNVFGDIAHGNLSAVSWVLSPYPNSDSPGTHDGPRWVDGLVKTLKSSSYWKSSAVIVIWQNEGNGQFYDNVAPPQLDPMGLGFRVPMIVVSPYAKHGYVSHTQYEFGSILKFIEENWGLPPLGGSATDKRANSIGDIFNFAQ